MTNTLTASPLPSLYFDYNATAPLCTAAKQAVTQALSITGNPSSIHRHGRATRQIFEDARQTLSSILKAGRFDHLVFNSGGTEGNNAVLKTFQTPEMLKNNAVILTSKSEHPCVLKSAPHALLIDALPDGTIDLTHLETLLTKHRQTHPKAPILVSCMLVNNETGVIQPLSQIIKVAHSFDAYCHSDIVQGLGRIPFDLEDFPLDYATISSHKIGGLTGFGALYCRAKVPFEPLIEGGGQEKNRRSGTSNITGAVAFNAALLHLDHTKWAPLKALRDHIEHEILHFCPQARIWGQKAQRVANTSSIMMPDVNAMTQMMSFDLDGISVSAGSACSSGTVKPSHVLKAMGILDHEALNTIRISLTPDATRQDCNRFVETWKTIYNRCHNQTTHNHSDTTDVKG